MGGGVACDKTKLSKSKELYSVWCVTLQIASPSIGQAEKCGWVLSLSLSVYSAPVIICHMEESLGDVVVGVFASQLSLTLWY